MVVIKIKLNQILLIVYLIVLSILLKKVLLIPFGLFIVLFVLDGYINKDLKNLLYLIVGLTPFLTILSIFIFYLPFAICGLLFEAHNYLGRYCNEVQYGDFLENLLKNNNLKYEREKNIPISFKGEKPGRNKIDFLVEDIIIIELKAKRILLREDYYQLKRYLVSFKKELGLLVNFRDKFLKPRRILNSSMK